jgi:acyl transferase domain-containing protein
MVLATEEIYKTEESSRVYEGAYSPPLCTAIQIALIMLLRSWGIRPIAVVGHSSGKLRIAKTFL